MMMRISMMWLLILLGSCEKESKECDNSAFFNDVDRTFNMGFTTWNYAPENSAVEDTYDFILKNGDIYAEQIDEYIPWRSYIEGTELSEDFLLKMEFKSIRRPANMPLSLSVSFLDTDRSAILSDQDGFIPQHNGFDDAVIVDAYEKHLSWLISKFNPDFFIFSMEVNDLFIKDRVKWDSYKRFSSEMRKRISSKYPTLKISESITLHSWFEPETQEVDDYNREIEAFIKDLDFVALSFYPFLKGLRNKAQFQEALDFMHLRIDQPIAIVETNHLAETLELSSFDLKIESDPCEQKEYLETLLANAQEQDYEFVIWWAHRDYDLLWETFPDDVKDIGKLWRDTGLLDESGNERPAFDCWKLALNH